MKKGVKLLILVFWMGLIFFFSSQPDVRSAETSSLAARIIYRICAFLLKDAVALSESEFMLRYVQPIRKLAHFSEFMILSILVYINVSEYRKKDICIVSFLISVLYAISDEIHQLFVVNRCCSFYDVLIDSAGCFLGILLCHLIHERWKKSH